MSTEPEIVVVPSTVGYLAKTMLHIPGRPMVNDKGVRVPNWINVVTQKRTGRPGTQCVAREVCINKDGSPIATIEHAWYIEVSSSHLRASKPNVTTIHKAALQRLRTIRPELFQ